MKLLIQRVKTMLMANNAFVKYVKRNENLLPKPFKRSQNYVIDLFLLSLVHKYNKQFNHDWVKEQLYSLLKYKPHSTGWEKMFLPRNYRTRGKIISFLALYQIVALQSKAVLASWLRPPLRTGGWRLKLHTSTNPLNISSYKLGRFTCRATFYGCLAQMANGKFQNSTGATSETLKIQQN